jgi:hypothetical protein
MGGAIRAAVLAMCLGQAGESFALTYGMEGWRYVLGQQTKGDYLSRSHATYPYPPFAVYEYINKNLPLSSKILLLGEARGLYLQRGHVAASVFDEPPLIRWAREARSGEELAERLRREGITHLVVNLGEAQATKGYRVLAFDDQELARLAAFWKRHVKEVVCLDETYGGKIANRVCLLEILPPGDAARPHAAPPFYFAPPPA